jgi:hypothetical protein
MVHLLLKELDENRKMTTTTTNVYLDKNALFMVLQVCIHSIYTNNSVGAHSAGNRAVFYTGIDMKKNGTSISQPKSCSLPKTLAREWDTHDRLRLLRHLAPFKISSFKHGLERRRIACWNLDYDAQAHSTVRLDF